MPDTTHLALPLMEAAQAQKHVTHNEALDGLVQLSVKSRVLATPPATPADGDRYLLPASATGIWVGHAGQLAISLAGAWRYTTATEGWTIWVDDEDVQLVFNGAAWVANTSGGAGTPGGTSGQIQFNNAGALGGVTMSGDVTLNTSTGAAVISNGAVSNVKTALMPANTIKGNSSAASASSSDLSAGQVNAMLPTFTSSGASAAKGLVPAPPSTAGSTRFLREDASWSELQNLPSLGVNTTADATNKLSVNSSALLFNHAGNGVQVKLNKNLPTDTASFLFQTGFSGCAEIGTTGDNDFHFKVSGNGSTFSESIIITGNSGLVTMKNGLAFDPVASDPSAPLNGQVWYNSTTGKLRARQAGVSTDIVGAGGGGGIGDGGISDGDKGDITVSSAGSVWSIDAQSISNSKLATMAAGTVKANLTGTAAAPSDITPSALLDAIGSTQGQLLYRGSSGWTALDTGSAGQVLQSGGAAATPSWVSTLGAGFTSTVGLTANAGAGALNKTSEYQYFEYSASGPSGTTGFSLPPSTGSARLIVKNKTANSIIVFPPTGGNIDGAGVNTAVQHPGNCTIQYISIDGSNNWTTIRLNFTSTVGLTAGSGAAPLNRTSDFQYFEFSASGPPNTTGFTLPVSNGAARLIVNNKTPNSIIAFPPTGGSIDGAAINALVPHPANCVVQYVSVDGSNNWTAIRLASPETITPALVLLPADPGNGKLVYGVYQFAGRTIMGARAAFESWIPEQNIINRAQIGFWQPPGNATTVPGVLGMAAPTVLGTATARGVATTTRATRRRRLGYVSAATVGALSGHYSTNAQHTIGDGAGNGGFLYACRFVVADAAAVAGARMFVGLRNAVTAPTNIEPNAQTNLVGVGQLSTSNNLHIIYGGSTAQTAIDLGVNFPVNTLSADLYELTLYSPPGAANTLHYRVERIGTGFVATGQLAPGTAGVTLPAATTLLAHAAWRTNNATALAVGIDICNIYFEQLD
jgi:hypothetical protein